MTLLREEVNNDANFAIESSGYALFHTSVAQRNRSPAAGGGKLEASDPLPGLAPGRGATFGESSLIALWTRGIGGTDALRDNCFEYAREFDLDYCLACGTQSWTRISTDADRLAFGDKPDLVRTSSGGAADARLVGSLASVFKRGGLTVFVFEPAVNWNYGSPAVADSESEENGIVGAVEKNKHAWWQTLVTEMAMRLPEVADALPDLDARHFDHDAEKRLEDAHLKARRIKEVLFHGRCFVMTLFWVMRAPLSALSVGILLVVATKQLADSSVWTQSVEKEQELEI